MKKITIEMPDNIECLLITYLQSISLGNINIGQKVVVTKDVQNEDTVIIDTSKTDVFI